MSVLRVTAAAVNQTPLDWSGNRRRIAQALSAAKKSGSELVLLPELAISGYGCEDYFFAESTPFNAWRVLQELVAETKELVVVVGLPVRALGSLYNAVAVLADGDLLGLAAKQNLASDGVHYEQRWFKPWPAGERIQLRRDGVEIPFGDLLFDLGGIRLGVEICEDAWVSHRPGVRLDEQGVDVICNPSASHFALGKSAVRRRFVEEGSRAFNAVYVYANLLGNESGRLIFDGETSIATQGRVVSQGRRLSFSDFSLCTASCDVEQNRLARLQRVSHVDDIKVQPIAYPFRWAGASLERTSSRCLEEPDSSQEFGLAVSLGLFDYLRKSRSHGFVVSLSGGIDSSATVALVYLMVRLAIAELGWDGFRERLQHIPELAVAGSSGALEALLTCAYQGTAHNSNEGRSAARALAKETGARYLEWELDGIIARFSTLVENGLGFQLDWSQHDTAMQNLQARSRVPALWMVANLRNSLLLTTSNRSEISVGYATQDGDTAGGLAPIAGVSKTFLTAWLSELSGTGIRFAVLPAPACLESLRKVLASKPSAELRPLNAAQFDETDLMPYQILDSIERHAIHARRSPAAVLRYLCAEMGDSWPQAQLKDWVIRFFRLWSASQWKRERLAPSFHLDDENLDPRSWCRFPILSGSFADQIAELERTEVNDAA